jgi:hypothetical protein
MSQPFSSSIEHLLAHLERVDLMVRGRIALARRVQAEDEHFRGLYISEQEVDALLRRPRGAPRWLDESGHWSGIAEALSRLEADIGARAAAAQQSGVELRLDQLQAAFALETFDRDVLLLCLAAELDLRYEKLYAYLQDDVTRKRPTVDLALNLLAPSPTAQLEARSRFAEDKPLRRHRLIELFEDPAAPHPALLARGLKPDDRIVQYLLGQDEAIDARLRPFAELLELAQLNESPIGLLGLPAGLVRMAARRGGEAPVIHLVGLAGSGRRTLAAALCREAGGRRLMAVRVDALLAESAPAATLLAMIEREARLQNAALLFEQIDVLQAPPHQAALRALCDMLRTSTTVCFVSGLQGWDNPALPSLRHYVHLALPRPDGTQRLAMWQRALRGEAVEEDIGLDSVAGRFKLGFGQISEAAAAARCLARLRNAQRMSAADVYEACRNQSSRQLGALARKIVPRYGWDDIILPADRIGQLRELCNHMKYRERVYAEWGFGHKLALGKGLMVLFAGPSGTGKTMAADVIARELGLELYKIDLSSVISKYIGETEKNLARIFDEAETSNAILFFDEADALFGKRSEVKDSHDRYANIEVGYLLQRMEEYEGVAILATNLRKNMDDAFVRRLHFTIDMPFPDETHRHRIWQGIWPKNLPRDDDIDLAQLAQRYEMTGGNIRNVALAAAFLAADDGDVVCMRHVMHATQREYQKTGKLLRENEFAVGRRA